MSEAGRDASRPGNAIAHPFTCDERFRTAERLRKRPEFKRTERRGRRKGGRSLVVYAAPNDLGYSRLGITVTKKVGRAVARTRWKRRIRDIFRRNKDRLPVGWDIVVIVRTSTKTRDEPSYDALRDEMLELARKAAETFEEKQRDD